MRKFGAGRAAYNLGIGKEVIFPTRATESNSTLGGSEHHLEELEVCTKI